MIIIKNKYRKGLKVLLIIVISSLLLIGGLYLYAFCSPKLPIKTNGKFYLYDNNSNLVYQGSSKSSWADFNKISDNLKYAIIATEDKNFYKHQGFDYPRIIKALLRNIKHRKVVEGASTISQQYVKNMYLSFDKNIKRKLEEALLTLEIEVHYSKDDILEGYLNTINFGEGNYGIESASNYYFNKKASELTIEEACILAGIPKSPANYNPVSNYDKSIKRAKLVANNMYKNGYISKSEYKNLFKNKVEIYEEEAKKSSKTFLYYQDAVLSELSKINKIPDSLIKSGGLKIYTELDQSIQTNLENAVSTNMKEDSEEIAALYINPSNGGINALIGGKNYNNSSYNRVTMSKRQVGSTIKPFLYYTALQNGLTSASTFESSPTTFNLSKNNTYSPSNYNDIYANKNISMLAALAYSDNIYAVKTHLFLGEDALVNTLKKLGIKEDITPIPSLALGTKEINMLDYSTAYIVLASGGYERNVHLIKKVEDMSGKVLYKYKPKNRQLLDYRYVYIINQMMTNSYKPEMIDYNSPTAISLKGRLNKTYSIKTGTTDNDHWIIGYNKDALLMVWTGTDNNKDKNPGYSKITKNIWADAIETSLKDKDNNFYEMPKSVIGVPLDKITGEYNEKNSIMYYFIKGTEPIIYKKEN